MKYFSCLAAVLLTVILAASSHADFTAKGHVHTLSESQQVFLNPHCRATDSCDLKRFTLTTSVYEVWFSDDPNHPTYSNGVIMEYETDSVAALENYAIVQFIKGCVFHSSKNDAGTITREFSYVVPSFGETVPFCFPNWVIDSVDTDPVYNSDPEYGRFYLQRWNRPGSYDHRSHKYYGAQKPQLPVLYMTDNPAGAFVTGTGVKNAALEFNTCIFKTRDVPAETRRENVNFAQPIACFPWQNVYVFDFANGSFQSDLAAVSPWNEPPARVRTHRIVLALFLLIAVTVVIFIRRGMLRSQRGYR